MCVSGIYQWCQPEEDADAPHLQFEKLQAQRARDIAEAAERNVREQAEEEAKAKEWQRELQEIHDRRSTMTDEEIAQDCLKYFAVIDNEATPTTVSGGAGTSADAADVFSAPSAPGLPELPEEDSALEVDGPHDVLKLWLQSHMDAAMTSRESELPMGTPAELQEVLAQSIAEAEVEITELQEPLNGKNLSLENELDLLIQKYSNESQVERGPTLEEQERVTAKVEALTAEVSRRKILLQRLHTLQPCLEDDTPSSRIAVALVLSDASSAGTAEAISCCRQLSTEDVCWALCSEKGQLIMEQLIPGIDADGKWVWQDVRATGLVWWLRKPVVSIDSSDIHNAKLLDQLLTKFAQAAMAQLKRLRAKDPLPDAESMAQRRHLGDEIVFWYVLQGASIPKLKALFKTGMLEDEGVQRLLEHPRSSEAELLRKNAFALLGKHRFLLAAALFYLGEFVEDAAKVCITHMNDLQLMLLTTRRHADLAQQLLQEELDSVLARKDPWVKLLLAWHSGQRDELIRMQTTVEVVEMDCSLPFFDGVLCGSSSAADLPKVAKRMVQPP